MNVTIVPDVDIDYLDARLLDNQGHLRLLPAEAYAAIPRNHVRLWAHRRGRYLLPTAELVAWLLEVIAGRWAIEVGAGAGDLGHHLGIPATDSYLQQRDPAVMLLLRLAGVAPTKPSNQVEALDAIAALEKYQPKVVVASWLMQLYQDGDEHHQPKIGSSMVGADEGRILAAAQTYIHIGNTHYHADKRILHRPHQAYRFPWIVSKAADPTADVIYVWER